MREKIHVIVIFLTSEAFPHAFSR